MAPQTDKPSIQYVSHLIHLSAGFGCTDMLLCCRYTETEKSSEPTVTGWISDGTDGTDERDETDETLRHCSDLAVVFP